MSREPNDQRPAPAADEAASWFARLQDEAVTGDDWLAFEHWLSAAPENQVAYEKLERLWVELDDAADEVKAALDAPVSLDAARVRRAGPTAMSRRRWMVASGALAASVALAVVIASNHGRPAAVTYETGPGETRQVVLADGTKVWLNASSKIVARFDSHARRVEMADAEATFDVTHDPARPFLIAVGDREVRVVGTEFNLRRRDAELILTVRRGVVEVRPATAPQAAATKVTAGQQLVHQEGAANSTLAAAEPDAAFAWTQGQLIYEDAPLSQVAADLTRSLAIPVRVADPAAGRVRFTGVLTLEGKAAVLRRLEAFAPVRAETRADGVVLHRR